MVPKILFLKNSISQLSNAVSTVPIALLDQKLQPEEKKSDFKMYFYFREIFRLRPQDLIILGALERGSLNLF